MNGKAKCPKCKRVTLTYRPKNGMVDCFVEHDHGDDACSWSHETVMMSQVIEPVSLLLEP